MLRHHAHVWDPIRVPHLGQWSYDRTTKAGHMTAFDQTNRAAKSLRDGGRPHMGTGRSLSSGRAERGPVGRCDKSAG